MSFGGAGYEDLKRDVQTAFLGSLSSSCLFAAVSGALVGALLQSDPGVAWAAGIATCLCCCSSLTAPLWTAYLKPKYATVQGV